MSFYIEVSGDVVEYFKETKIENIALLHGCNCQNLMGAGVAKQIKKELRQFYQEDSTFYSSNKPNSTSKQKGNSNILGKAKVFKMKNLKEKFGINAYTQLNIHTQGARLQDIQSAFEHLLEQQKDDQSLIKNIKVIIMPQIGAGLGGLSWQEVKPIIQDYAEKLKIKLVVVNFNKKEHNLNKFEEIVSQ